MSGAQADFMNGVLRELSTLRPQFASAAREAAEAAPKCVRAEMMALLTQLCDPVPANRLPRRRGRPLPATDGLPWQLRRADIMRTNGRGDTK